MKDFMDRIKVTTTEILYHTSRKARYPSGLILFLSQCGVGVEDPNAESWVDGMQNLSTGSLMSETKTKSSVQCKHM